MGQTSVEQARPLAPARAAAVEVSGLLVTQAWFAPDLRLPRHRHARASLAVILGGGFSANLAGRDLECGAGALVVTPAEEAHDNRFSSRGARVLVIEPAPRAGPGDRFGALLDRPCLSRDPALLAMAHRLSQELHAPDAHAGMVIEGLSLELLGGAARERDRELQGPRPPPWLARVADLIRGRFAEPLRLSDLGREAGVSELRVTRAHRAFFGCSPATALRRARLEAAARLLRETTGEIAAIALATGFADQSHLTRQLRKSLGITPAALRRTVRL